jgi:tRNA 5-methylaminomethyl-2-thiouridine biosynthesis bifunctional protein
VLAPLAAELLACQITGDPLLLEQELVAALHPGRFLIRALKRQR